MMAHPLKLLCFLLLCAAATLCVAATNSNADNSNAAKTYKLLLWTPKCYDTWFTDYSFFDVDCLKSIVSRGLSFGIIVGSSVLKLPQMYNFYRAKSTFGVSSTMLYLDVISFTPSPIYNVMKLHPFFTYGEQIIVLTENIILIAMMWYYDKNNSLSKSIGIALVYALLVFGFFHAPAHVWWLYPLIGAAAATLGRIPQIVDNYNSQNTGTLSAFTFFLNSLGGVARMFTTMNTTGDLSIVASQFVGVSVSVVILIQMGMYWQNTKKALQDFDGKEK